MTFRWGCGGSGRSVRAFAVSRTRHPAGRDSMDACRYSAPMKRSLIAAAFVLLLAGCGGKAAAKPAAPKTITVAGDIQLYNGAVFETDASNSSCTGFQGYSDIGAGAQIVVYDAAGTILANGSLKGGTADQDSIDGKRCRFPFAVPNVPATGGPYAIEISHRGKFVFQQAQAGNVEMTLGS